MTETIEGTTGRADVVETAEFASFGAVHLEVTDVERAAAFWTDAVGLTRRSTAGDEVELGTGREILVVLHPGATAPFRQGHSGIYHLAVHVPAEGDLARVLLRLARSRVPVSPTDHIMSKALYLVDPDGITVELTLETPWRMQGYVMDGPNVQVIDADGNMRGVTEALDVDELMRALPDDDTTVPIPDGARIGHVHLYVADLARSFDYYQSLGFSANMWAPRIRMADLSAGGPFKHRLALNTWQGEGAPVSPAGTARMRHFTLRYADRQRLAEVLADVGGAEDTGDGYRVTDPSGNQVLLTAEP